MPNERCECTDPGCPIHPGKSECSFLAATTLYRVDMEDQTGTLMCERCADDAYEAGVFRFAEDDAENDGA